MRESRREELALEANHFGEQAAYAHLDGAHEHALAASDRAVKALERLHRAFAEDREVTEGLSEALRNRAEIRRELGRRLDRAGDRAAATAQFRAAIPDAERAIALRRESGAGADGKFPLWVPSVQLLLGELHVWSADGRAAEEVAGRAMAVYRTVSTADQEIALVVAHALSRHGTLLADIADLDGALVARRDSVALYRRHLGPEGRLWRNRHSQGTAWVSTPTWGRWCDTAVDLARLLKVLRLDAAPEALLLLQDAAEGYAALVPDHMFNRLLPGTQGHVARMDRTVTELESWLAELGHGDLADLYRRTAYTLVTHGGRSDWPGVLRDLRPALDAVLAR